MLGGELILCNNIVVTKIMKIIWYFYGVFELCLHVQAHYLSNTKTKASTFIISTIINLFVILAS